MKKNTESVRLDSTMPKDLLLDKPKPITIKSSTNEKKGPAKKNPVKKK